MDNPAFSGAEPSMNGILPTTTARQRKPRDKTSSDDAASTTTSEMGSSDVVGLKKRVGLISGISLIIGTMIGSGIFISPKGVTSGSGSVGFSLINWGVCGVIALFGALSMAELGTLIPKSGGEYAYLLEAFGPIPAFLYSWVSMFLLKPSSVAIISLTCAEYVMVPMFDDGCGEPPVVNRKLVAAVVILILAAVNSYSVKLATQVQVFFTGAKVLALVIIIIGGLVMLGKGNTEHLSTGFEGTISDVGAIAIGYYNGMWAYDGWNNLNMATEELQNPYVNLPRAIWIGIPMVTILYLMVNVSYFTVMSVDMLLDSPAVAITWAEEVIPAAKWLIPIFVALSTFGAANGSMFTTGRLTFVAAREGHMVEVLSMVSVTQLTPSPSIIFTTFIAILMIIPGDIGSLIDFFSFAMWMFYGAAMAALIVLRFTRKNDYRPYKVPIIIPIIILLVSVFLVVVPIVLDPQIEFLYAAIFIVAGLIFYLPFVHFKYVLPGMGSITKFFQLLLEVSPADTELQRGSNTTLVNLPDKSATKL